MTYNELPTEANIFTSGSVITINTHKPNKQKLKHVPSYTEPKTKTKRLLHIQALRSNINPRDYSLHKYHVPRFRIWIQDMSKAYLRFSRNLLRDVYLKPGREFEMNGTTSLKSHRPFYDFADSGHYWNNTFADHIKTE